MTDELEWHAKARDLDGKGLNHREIAALVGKSRSTVTMFLNGSAQRHSELMRTSRGAYDRRTISRERKPVSTVPWPELVRDATRAFAAGEITREEMMTRLGKPKRQEMFA